MRVRVHRGWPAVLAAAVTAAGCSSPSPNPVAPPVYRLSAGASPVDEVDPLIGTGPALSAQDGRGVDSGDVFPGAVAPAGLLAWSPDTTSANPGGYSYPDRAITGFSLTHFSGRGCVYRQDVPIMAVPGVPAARPPAAPGGFPAGFSHPDGTAPAGASHDRAPPALTAAPARTT